MISHEVDSEQLPSGEYRLTCARCGEIKETTKANWHGECKGPPCPHLGKETGESVKCSGCRGEVKLKVYSCDIATHPICLPFAKKSSVTTPAVHKCHGCDDRPKNHLPPTNTEEKPE